MIRQPPFHLFKLRTGEKFGPRWIGEPVSKAELPTIQSPSHHAKQASTRPFFPAWLQLRMLPWQMKHAAESVSRISRHPHSAAPPQSIPLACSASSARAFVRQITSKCLPLRRGETKKHRFVPGSARNLKKAATPLLKHHCLQTIKLIPGFQQLFFIIFHLNQTTNLLND